MATLKERRIEEYGNGETFNIAQSMYDSNMDVASKRKNILGAVAARGEYEHNLRTKQTALGPANMGMTLFDPKTKKPFANMKYHDQFTNKLVTSDSKGNVVYTNKAVVDEKLKIHEYEQKTIDDLMGMNLVSDELTAGNLQLSLDELINHLQAGGKFAVPGKGRLSTNLINADGLPSSLEYMVPKSKEQLAGIAKMRALVKSRMEFINIADFDRSEADRYRNAVQDPKTVTRETRENAAKVQGEVYVTVGNKN